MCKTKHSETADGDAGLNRRRVLAAALAGGPLLIQPAKPAEGHTRKGKDSSMGNEGKPLRSAPAMRTAAEAFLNLLSPDPRAKATFGLDEEERQKWFYTP